MLRCVYHYRILFVVRGRKIFPLELPFPPSFFFLFLRSCPLPYLRRWRTNGSVNRSFAYRSIRSFLAIVQRKRYGFKSVNRLLLESCHTRFDASRFSRPRQFSSLFSFLLCFVFFFFVFFFLFRVESRRLRANDYVVDLSRFRRNRSIESLRTEQPKGSINK